MKPLALKSRAIYNGKEAIILGFLCDPRGGDPLSYHIKDNKGVMRHNIPRAQLKEV